jgi:hypothetical protein
MLEQTPGWNIVGTVGSQGIKAMLAICSYSGDASRNSWEMEK